MAAKKKPQDIAAQRNFRLILASLVIALAGAAYGIYWWQHERGWVTIRNAYVAGDLVLVKAAASGMVVSINVEDLQQVHAGDLLVKLDDAAAAIALEEAKAALALAVREVESLYNLPVILQHRREALQAALRNQRGGAGSRQSPHQGISSAPSPTPSIDELKARIQQTEAELKSANTQIIGTTVATHPRVLTAAARVKRAYLERLRQTIRAPVSGVIATRRIQPGVAVTPGQPLFTIMPLEPLWIQANVKETEIAQIRPGQTAVITVDAYGSSVIYHGVVAGLSPGTGSVFSLLPKNNATGNFIRITQWVPVRILLDADELRRDPLRPGLSTVTRINLRDEGSQVVKPRDPAHSELLSSAIFADELTGADDLIASIIKSHTVLKRIPQDAP